MIVNFKSVKSYKLLSHLVILMTILIFPVSNAWTYEKSSLLFEHNVSREALRIKPEISSIVTDTCKYLLKSDNNNSTTKSFTPHNQRKAGKLAALGIILGARFAIRPNDNTSGNSNSSAQAIAKFRKCHKEKTLNIMAKAY